MNRTKGGLTALVALTAVSAAVLSGCGTASGSGGGKVKLSLVAYSTPQAAYEKIIKAFQATPAGKNVDFTQSYGASGDQSRAVASALPADVVEFSLQPDMQRLVDANIVAPSWDQNKYKGMVTNSVVVIATHKGNPKGIKDWPDLVKP